MGAATSCFRNRSSPTFDDTNFTTPVRLLCPANFTTTNGLAHFVPRSPMDLRDEEIAVLPDSTLCDRFVGAIYRQANGRGGNKATLTAHEVNVIAKILMRREEILMKNRRQRMEAVMSDNAKKGGRREC